MINELPEVGPMEAWVAASNRADPMYQGFFITEQFTAKEKAREVDAEIASLRAELQAEQERSERYRVALKKARLAIHSEYCGNGRHHECCLAVSSALDQKE